MTLAASLVAFAVARYDSTWMPNPQLNVLSWSYAVAAVSFVLTLIAFIVGFLRYLYLEAIFEDQKAALLEHQDEMGKSSPPTRGVHAYERIDNERYPADIDDAPEQLEPDGEFQSDLLESERVGDVGSRYMEDDRNFEPHRPRNPVPRGTNY